MQVCIRKKRFLLKFLQKIIFSKNLSWLNSAASKNGHHMLIDLTIYIDYRLYIQKVMIHSAFFYLRICRAFSH